MLANLNIIFVNSKFPASSFHITTISSISRAATIPPDFHQLKHRHYTGGLLSAHVRMPKQRQFFQNNRVEMQKNPYLGLE